MMSCVDIYMYFPPDGFSGPGGLSIKSQVGSDLEKEQSEEILQNSRWGKLN